MDFQFPLSIEEIKKFLPHRAPFLLVDRILEINYPSGMTEIDITKSNEGISAVGIKNVSFNEAHMQGHFPEFSIMPGVLILESMAQVGSFCVYPYFKKYPEKFPNGLQVVLLGVSHAKFRKPVVPGDTLKIQSTVAKSKSTFWELSCQAFVEDKKVAEAHFLAKVGG